MIQEIKIHIDDVKEIEKTLLKLGAKFNQEVEVRDTYYHQKHHQILKIVEDKRAKFLVLRKFHKGILHIKKFEIIEKGIQKIKRELKEKYGVKCILKRVVRIFELDGYVFYINLITNKGNFLIMEGINVSKAFIKNKLKIKNPKVIEKSFADLCDT